MRILKLLALRTFVSQFVRHRELALSIFVVAAFIAEPVNAQINFKPPVLVNTHGDADVDRDFDAALAVNAEGNWVAVWSASDDRLEESGLDLDIFSARSVNGGGTWSVAIPVNLANADIGRDINPDVASNGFTTADGGKFIAVWSSDQELDGAGGTDTDIFYSTSKAGIRWSEPRVLNGNATRDAENDNRPRVVSVERGVWIVAWESTENLAGVIGSDADIFYSASFDDGDTWNGPLALNRNAGRDSGNDSRVRLASTRKGRVIAVWDSTENLGGPPGSEDFDILAASTDDGGRSWTSPTLVNSGGSTDGALDVDLNPTIATDRNGNWIATWSSGNNDIGSDSDIFFSRSSDFGVTWSPEAALNTDADFDSGFGDHLPSIAASPGGTWLAAWARSAVVIGSTDLEADIYQASSLDGGDTWSFPRPVDPRSVINGSSDFRPAVQTDGEGNWVVLMDSPDRLNDTKLPDQDILVTRSTNAGRTWTTRAALEMLVDREPGRADDVSVAYSSAENVAIAVWSSTTGAFSDTDIFYSVSIDRGSTWGRARSLSDTSGFGSGLDLHPSIATDDEGRWVVVWEFVNAGRGGTENDILFSFSDDNGLSWRRPGRIFDATVFPETLGSAFPRVEHDGLSTWIVVWSALDEGLGSDRDILFSRAIGAGLGWSVPSPLNTDALLDAPTDNDFFPSITAPQPGHWIAIWTSRDESDEESATEDLHVSRSDNGGVSWSRETILFPGEVHHHNLESRVAAFGDVLVATWTNADGELGIVGTDLDVLASRSVDGGREWTAPVLVSSTPREDEHSDARPDIDVDETGRWVIAWHSRLDEDNPGGGDMDVWFSSSVDGGGTWSQPASMLEEVDADTSFEILPDIVSTGRGGWTMVWISNDDLGRTVDDRFDVFASTGLASSLALPIISTRSSSGGGCFIATAAYGTSMDGDLDTLRAFRDRYLLTNVPGTAFADLYYRFSPPVADVVAASPTLAGVVRVSLTPVVFSVSLLFARPVFVIAVTLVALFAAIGVYLLRRLERRGLPS